MLRDSFWKVASQGSYSKIPVYQTELLSPSALHSFAPQMLEAI